MDIAVTGATGHLGACLLRRLVADGHHVIAIAREPNAASIQNLPVERIATDVRDYSTLLKIFKDCDYVFHLAGYIAITKKDSHEVLSVNRDGVKNVAQAAFNAKIKKMVHVSSIHAYCHNPLEDELDEKRTYVNEKAYIYDKSKAAGEIELKKIIALGLPAIIVNPCGIIGPFDFAPSLMGKFLLSLFKNKMPAVVEGGFNWVDVRDVVNTMINALEKGRVGENYIVSGKWHSVLELAQLVSKILGKTSKHFVIPNQFAQWIAPVVEYGSRLLGKNPVFTSCSIKTLISNQFITSKKAQIELGHSARPIETTLQDLFIWWNQIRLLSYVKQDNTIVSFH